MAQGEKGQQYIRYNVNGITIDDLAFAKLKTEVDLKSKLLKINGVEYLFHVGQYPDIRGRKKDIVIREGKVGLWNTDTIVETRDDAEPYYEVVVNQKVIPSILGAFNKTRAPTQH